MVHNLFLAEQEDGPMRWMLYDGISGNANAKKLELVDNVVQRLRDILSNIPPFWHEFKRFSEMLARTGDLILSGGENSDIAAIIASSSVTGERHSRTVVCYQNGVGCTFIKTFNSLYFPLHHVLINPHGTHEWSTEYKARHNTSMLMYYRQILLRHEPLQYLGPLLMELLVDCYSGIEEQRLNYLRFNQKNICR